MSFSEFRTLSTMIFYITFHFKFYCILPSALCVFYLFYSVLMYYIESWFERKRTEAGCDISQPARATLTTLPSVLSRMFSSQENYLPNYPLCITNYSHKYIIVLGRDKNETMMKIFLPNLISQKYFTVVEGRLHLI